MEPRIEFDKLDWYSVLPKLGVNPEWIQNPRRPGPCPIEGGGKTRFRMDNKDGRGTWICNNCGSGDGVRLVALIRGTDDAEAVRAIRDEVFGRSSEPQKFIRKTPIVDTFKKTPQQIENARHSLARTWTKAKSLQGTPSEAYLKGRVHGLDSSWLAPTFRHHESLFHFDEGNSEKSFLPALVSRVVDASDPTHVVTLHRTYISNKGVKANVSPDQVKKLMTATVEKVRGESILLNTAKSEWIVVTEGIENGLAWVAATKNRLTVFAAMNCGNLGSFKWPAGTKGIIIATDHDAVNPKTGLRPGYHHALVLKGRAIENGLTAVVKVPPVLGLDWDDIWNAGDLKTFRLARKANQKPATPEKSYG